MAAHVKTGLEQVLDDIHRIETGDYLAPAKNLFDQIFAACEFSTWTEQLQAMEWQRLREIAMGGTDLKALKAFAEELLPKYTKEWEKLNKPHTREEWLNCQLAEWGGSHE